MSRFLCRNDAGVLIALGLAAFAVGLLASAPAGVSLVGASGGVLLVGSGVLAAGASYHLYRARQAARRFPAPGRMIDVGGFDLHILAEGRSGGAVPVIWVAGGHGQGLLMHPLHAQIKDETRSIVFDRAGSGWSDAGPFPRSLPTEIDELARLLERAEEQGPFLMVGHSFGGMFCANFAQRHPEQVAGLVLLDPTPPWNMTFARDISIAPIRAAARKGGVAALFGLGWRRIGMDREAVELSFGDGFAGLEDQVRLEHAFPKTHWSSGSALWTATRTPFDLVIGAGALGDIPLRVLIAPSDREELRNDLAPLGFSTTQFENLWAGNDEASRQTPRLSSRGELHLAPDGTGHMFPYEAPDFVLGHVRALLAEIGTATSRSR